MCCTNCKGHGHQASNCPSPNNMRVQCKNCGKAHPTEECWYLSGNRPNGSNMMIPNSQFDVNQVQGGPRFGWTNRDRPTITGMDNEILATTGTEAILRILIRDLQNIIRIWIQDRPIKEDRSLRPLGINLVSTFLRNIPVLQIRGI